MAHEIPTAEPLSVTVGDLVTWKRTLADYPATSWTLSYALTKSGAQITFSASASGSDHLVSVAKATTAAWAAGTYAIQGYVTSGSERYIVFDSEIVLLPNLAAESSGYDGRSHAKKCLDSIEAVLESRAGKEVQSWSGLEQSFSLIPTADLLTMRDKYRVEYQAEQAADRIARGLGNRRNVFTRFTPVR